jgi:hypothetical protein
MFNKILTISTLLLLSFTVLPAQTQNIEKTGGFARLQAMGNNPYVIDPFNMTLNSAWGAYYSDFIMGDLGSTATAFGNDGVGQFIGANFKVGSNMTVGAFLAKNDFNGQFSILNIDPYGVTNNIPGVITLNNIVELMATYSAGKHKFGFGFSYASSANEFNPAGSDATVSSASQIGLNFGYVSQLSGNLLLDVSLSLTFPGATYEQPNLAETTASESIISLNARTFIRMSQKFKLVPVLQFVTTSASGEVPSGTASENVDLPSTSVFILGVGFMYSTGDFLFAGGPAYASLSTTTPAVENSSPELSSGITGFPIWNLGGEWKFADWIVGRMGYMAITRSAYNESNPNPTDVDEAIQTIYGPTGFWLGLGFRTGGFSLDATINDDVLRQGLNTVGGLGATFAYISLSVAL